MNCQDARRLIEEQLDGEISESDRALLREHVSSCDACGGEIALELALDRVLSDSSLVRAPARLDVSVAHEIVHRAAVRRRMESMGLVSACVAAGASAAYGVSRALNLSAVAPAVRDAAESVRGMLPVAEGAAGEAPAVISAWSQDPTIMGVALACAVAAAAFLGASALREAKQFSLRRR
jgi:hypothetical protein